MKLYASTTCRLAEAKKQIAELRKDKTSNCITPKHLWKLAYWCAREYLANETKS